jgi:hypothetical protein
MALRSLFGLFSLILVAGGLLLMFFILLAGVVDSLPVSKWYFLEAATENIPGAPAVARWTYWNICNGESGRNDCGKVHPAFPLDPSSHRNFNTDQNVPEDFIKNHGQYFFMTRFMFAFMLIALFFAVCALFTGLLALCTRIGSYLSGLLTMIAAFFQAINAALMTAAYLKGSKAFRNNDQNARVGRYAFGFEWAALACFLLSTVLFCIGGGANKESSSGGFKSRGFKGRRSRSTRSRGSFVHDKEYNV